MDYIKNIDLNKDLQIEALQDLVSIKSVVFPLERVYRMLLRVF